MLAPLHHASYPVCGQVKNKNTTAPSTRRTLKLAAWNVHTLLDRDDRHKCHTAIIAHKLARYNIDIAALSETCISGSSQFEEVTFFCHGQPTGEMQHGEVGFAIVTKLMTSVCESPCAISPAQPGRRSCRHHFSAAMRQH